MEEEGEDPLQPALCRERLVAPRPSPAGRSGGRGDTSLVEAGPSSHCAVGVTGRVCMQLVPHILHTRLGLLDPFTIRDPGALRKLTTWVPPCSQPSQSQGWGSGGRLGSGKGLEERAGGSRLAGTGWGGGSLPGKPLLPPPRSPGLKSKFGGSRAGAPWPGPSPSRPQAQEPEAVAGLAQVERKRPGEATLSTRTLRDTVGPTASAPPLQGSAQGSPGQDLGPAGDERSAGGRGSGRRDSRSRGACASAGEARGRRAWRTARTERAGTAS